VVSYVLLTLCLLKLTNAKYSWIQHAVLFSFGLEGNVILLPASLFWTIISQDVAGGNPDPEKAKKMRTFLIPEKYIVPGSSSSRPRTIRILAAFVSKESVVVVCDFSGLAKMHVTSRATPWTKEDFLVGSEVCVSNISFLCLLKYSEAFTSHGSEIVGPSKTMVLIG